MVDGAQRDADHAINEQQSERESQQASARKDSSQPSQCVVDRLGIAGDY